MQGTDKNKISNIIRQQRILLDLTISELGRKAGVSPSLVGRLERGERFPSARTLRKLAKVLGISEVELLMNADYLSIPASAKKIEEDTQIMRLDPKVIFELSKETPATQRAVLTILKMLRGLVAEIASENRKDN